MSRLLGGLLVVVVLAVGLTAVGCGDKKTTKDTKDTKDTKAEGKPEAKPEGKPEAKPEAKPEGKPEAKPENKKKTGNGGDSSGLRREGYPVARSLRAAPLSVALLPARSRLL